ncbi:MAG TPA: alpha-L-rhamnosidase C-terminal domain-containing protein [Chthoniobacteraceae bacterium]|nr:alpha-L-rhamnosidase C-terminal domain-containing protein [Chthoniobacteraceae bacterium]
MSRSPAPSGATLLPVTSAPPCPFQPRTNGVASFITLEADRVFLSAAAPAPVTPETEFPWKERAFAFTRWNPPEAPETTETDFAPWDPSELETPWPLQASPLRPGETVAWRMRLRGDGCVSRWSAPARFACAPESLAPARWIGGPGYSLLRKRFSLPRPPKRAILWVSADPPSYLREGWEKMEVSHGGNDSWLLGGSLVKYRLWVNGRFVALGPPRPCGNHPVVQAFDVTTLLHEGENLLALLSLGERRGVALKLEMEGTDPIVSDETWRRLDGNNLFSPVAWQKPGIDSVFKGFTAPGELPQHLDGRIHPFGWEAPGFSGEKEWERTAGFGLADGPFEAAALPPFAFRMEAPRRVERQPDGSLLFDFGRQRFASVALEWQEPGRGEVELRLGEERTADGRVRYLWRTRNALQEIWQAPSSPGRLEHFGLRAFRYGSLHARRGGEVGEISISIRDALHPFDETASRFSSSDAALNRVWTFCRNTLRDTHYDLYTDCLSRERQPYEADALISMLSHHAVEEGMALARRTIEYLFYHPTWPQEWRLLMPLLLWNDYWQTGNPALIRRHLDAALAHIRPCVPEEGLVRRFPCRVIVDWPHSARDGYEMEGEFSAVPNAFLYEALRTLALCTRIAGRAKEALPLERDAARLKEAFGKRLFRPGEGICRDHPASAHASLHANVAALRFGLVPEPFREAVLDYIAERGMVCSPYFAQFYLETLYAFGRPEVALRLMTATSGNGWLPMMDRFGATSTMEAWSPEQKPNVSFAHPWATAPANLIVRGLAGIRAAEPGWGRFVIDPRPGPVTQWEIKAPTPRGPIEVECRQRDGRCEIVRWSAPPGMQRVEPASFFPTFSTP